MNTNLVSVRKLKVTAAVLGMLGFGSILHAEENGSTGIAREVVKSSISAESLEQCELVGLKRVYFQYDGSELTVKEKSTLTALANEFSQETQAIVELRGYTDGKEAQSKTALGAKRSEAIAHYLEAKGVPASSILLVGTDGADEQDGSANPEHRRVDVRVFTPSGTSLPRPDQVSVSQSAAGN